MIVEKVGKKASSFTEHTISATGEVSKKGTKIKEDELLGLESGYEADLNQDGEMTGVAKETVTGTLVKGPLEKAKVFADLDGDGVVGTIEDEKIVLEMRKQKAKLQKTEDVVTIVGLIFGGLMFSMLCQSIRRSGGIVPFWHSIPARFYAFYEASMLYLNCLCWVALVCIPFHRALGWIVGTYLTYLLGNEF